jgi:hypothetical protein
MLAEHKITTVQGNPRLRGAGQLCLKPFNVSISTPRIEDDGDHLCSDYQTTENLIDAKYTFEVDHKLAVLLPSSCRPTVNLPVMLREEQHRDINAHLIRKPVSFASRIITPSPVLS